MGNLASSEAQRETTKKIVAYKKALVEWEKKVHMYKVETEQQKELISRLKHELDFLYDSHSKQISEKEHELEALRRGCQEALSFLKNVIDKSAEQTAGDGLHASNREGLWKCEDDTLWVSDLIDIGDQGAKLDSSYESFI